jgi:hypothetical protein
MTLMLALGGCASAPSHDRPISTKTDLLTIRFDNSSRQTVDVYLIGVKREWILGRVAPGAVASLRLPDAAFDEGSMMVRLAVLAGERTTFAAARDPRAVLTIAEPASELLAQRWTFSQGNLISLSY